MTQELNFAQPELALAKLHIKLMITQSQKHNEEMLFLTLRKDQDDVNEDHDKLVQLFHENRVHEVCGGVGQTKRHHQILILRFRGGEKPMIRIGTWYPDQENKDQDRWNGGNLRATSSLSFSKQATKTDMMPCSQDQEGIIFQWWKLRGEDELQCMTSDVMCTISQKKAGECMRVTASSQDVPGHCETRKGCVGCASGIATSPGSDVTSCSMRIQA
jgi:hypothetical protein